MEQRFERLGDTFEQRGLLHTRDPQLAYEALVTQAERTQRVDSPLQPLLGDSVSVGDGPLWKQRRQMLQPLVRQVMDRQTPTLLEQLPKVLFDPLAQKGGVDLFQQGRALALTLTSEVWMGVSFSPTEREQLLQAISAITEMGSFHRAKDSEGNARWEEIEGALSDVLSAWWSSPRGPLGEVLWDAVSSGVLTEHEALQETYGLLLAGQDTLVLTLLMALWVLGTHPEFHASVPNSAFRQQLLNEVLRLYPPAYAIPRQVLQPLGDAKAGQQIILWTWFIHRSARLYEEPLEFRPQRWTARAAPGTFLPFGAGGHRCMGERLALQALDIVLEQLAPRLHQLRVPQQPPTFLPFMTLVPKEPFLASLEA